MASLNPLDNSDGIKVPAAPVKVLSKSELRKLKPIVRQTQKTNTATITQSPKANITPRINQPRRTHHTVPMSAKKLRKLQKHIMAFDKLLAQELAALAEIKRMIKIDDLTADLHDEYNMRPGARIVMTQLVRMSANGLTDVVVFQATRDPRRMIDAYRAETAKLLQAEIDAYNDATDINNADDLVPESADEITTDAAPVPEYVAEPDHPAMLRGLDAATEQHEFATKQRRLAAKIFAEFLIASEDALRAKSEYLHKQEMAYQAQAAAKFAPTPRKDRAQRKKQAKIKARARKAERASAAFDLTTKALRKSLRRIKGRVK